MTLLPADRDPASDDPVTIELILSATERLDGRVVRTPLNRSAPLSEKLGLDVVLKLEVVPLINNDNEVTLRIAQINDNIVGEQTISGNTVPTISTQELLTTVTVRNGATVVLGGLITERTGHSERGGIFLRRIPVLKHLFGTTEKSSSRDELLIFIQPNIINSTAQLDSPNRIESQRSRIMEETMRFGMPVEEIPRAAPYTK